MDDRSSGRVLTSLVAYQNHILNDMQLLSIRSSKSKHRFKDSLSSSAMMPSSSGLVTQTVVILGNQNENLGEGLERQSDLLLSRGRNGIIGGGGCLSGLKLAERNQ